MKLAELTYLVGRQACLPG